MDWDGCLSMLAKAVDEDRRGLGVLARGLDLRESTLCSNVAEVRTWATSALAEQQEMMLRVIYGAVMLGKAVEGSQCARHAEERAVEGVGEVYGEHGVPGTEDSTVEGDGFCPGRYSGQARVACGRPKRAGSGLRSRL